jgi:guanine deaminase
MNNQNVQKTGSSFLSHPIDANKEPYHIIPVPLAANDPNCQQPWSGFDPACTLQTRGRPPLPLQKANIKTGGLYNGIQIAGDQWMRMACEEATASVRNNGGPFGAVLLQIDKDSSSVLRYWKNHNQVTSINDPTAHAEVMAIRSACNSLGVFQLGHIEKQDSKLPQEGASSYCALYASAEPCPMCFSAICWARIPLLFFAATRFDTAVPGVDFSDVEILSELSKPYCDRTLKVYQCTVGNSLDAFNLWKRSPKTPY